MSTHQEIVQIGITLELLIRLLNGIIGYDVILFNLEVRKVKRSVTD